MLRRKNMLFMLELWQKSPKWVRIVFWITMYFTANHIYASWLFYAITHPNGLAAQILTPLGPPAITTGLWFIAHIFGLPMFLVVWAFMFVYYAVCYAVWIVFAGGIAELLHLVPR